MSTLPTLAISIVNWNGGNFILDCLNSISQCTAYNYNLEQIILVDNASTDDSLHKLKTSTFNFYLKIIENTKNYGFGHACNQAAKEVDSDYILFLNPDTILFADTLDKTFEFVAKNNNSAIGLIGIKQVDQNGKTLKTCNRFLKLRYLANRILGLTKLSPRWFPDYTMLEWDHESDRFIEQPMGAFYLIKKTIFTQLSGFNKDFFMYFEDADLCYRLAQTGYKAYYFAGAAMVHKISSTTAHIKHLGLFYNLQGRLIYSRKHFSCLAYCCTVFLTCVIEPITRIVFMLLKRNFLSVKEAIWGYRLLFRSFCKSNQHSRGN